MSAFDVLMKALDGCAVRYEVSGLRHMAVYGPDDKVCAVISETDHDYTSDPLSIEATGTACAMAAFIKAEAMTWIK